MTDVVADNKPVVFLDTREPAVPEELWREYSRLSTVESRQLTGKFLAYLSDKNTADYGKLMGWAKKVTAPRGNEVRYNDLVFAALCKTAKRLGAEPEGVVEMIVERGSARGTLIHDGAFLP